jgi:hypothetical protein
MGNLIWHEYSRLVAITASVCESPVLLPSSNNNNLANHLACVLSEFLQTLSGPDYGAYSGVNFFGISLVEHCETQEGYSEFIVHAQTGRKALSPDRTHP